MMKSICALARRSDLSRADFQSYYEKNHAPLGASHFPFRRYVRNHLLDAPDIGFDTISEFWAEDIGATAALMGGPVGEIMRSDERNFMDQSKIAPAGSDEHILSSGMQTGADGRRTALLIDWESDDATARNRLLGWAGEIAQRLSGVSVDFAQSWQQPPFPARAILWLPNTDSADSPPREMRVRALKVLRVETPPDALLPA